MDALEESISSYGKHTVDIFLAWLTLILILVMVMDSFVLQPVIEKETYKDANASSEPHVIITESGRRFSVPSRPFNTILPGQSFYIGQSRIFHRPLNITWTEDDGYAYKAKIGILNDFWTGTLASFIFAGLAAIFLLLRRNWPGQWTTIRMYTGLGITLMLFLMYLLQGT